MHNAQFIQSASIYLFVLKGIDAHFMPLGLLKQNCHDACRSVVIVIWRLLCPKGSVLFITLQVFASLRSLSLSSTAAIVKARLRVAGRLRGCHGFCIIADAIRRTKNHASPLRQAVGRSRSVYTSLSLRPPPAQLALASSTTSAMKYCSRFSQR